MKRGEISRSGQRADSVCVTFAYQGIKDLLSHIRSKPLSRNVIYASLLRFGYIRTHLHVDTRRCRSSHSYRTSAGFSLLVVMELCNVF